MACCDTNGCSIVDKCYSHTASTGCTSCYGSVGVDTPCSSNCSHTNVVGCSTCNTAQSDKPCDNCGSHNACTSANDYACSTNGSWCDCNDYGKCAMNCIAQNVNNTTCLTHCQSHSSELKLN